MHLFMYLVLRKTFTSRSWRSPNQIQTCRYPIHAKSGIMPLTVTASFLSIVCFSDSRRMLHSQWSFKYSSLNRFGPAVKSTSYVVRCSTVIVRAILVHTLHISIAWNATFAGDTSNCTSLHTSFSFHPCQCDFRILFDAWSVLILWSRDFGLLSPSMTHTAT